MSNYYVEYKPTLRERILGRFYRSKRVPVVKPDFEAADEIRTSVTCELSFLDRIKLIFTGKLQVDIRTATEIAPGKLKTESTCYVTY